MDAVTPEAQRLAAEAKARMIDFAEEVWEAGKDGFRCDSIASGRAALSRAEAAIDRLASLIPPGGLAEEARTIPLSAIRPIAVEAIRAITGCPDLLSGKRSLVDEMESVSQAAAKTFAALSAPTPQQEQPR